MIFRMGAGYGFEEVLGEVSEEVTPLRVAVVSLLQETNTFSPVMTGREDFLFIPANDLIASHRSENSELHGFVDILEQEGVEIVPILGGWAVTKGRVRLAVLYSLVKEIIDEIKNAGHVDGALLALHGAWAGEGCDSCDGYLLEHVRRLLGPRIPIVVTLDLHGNITRPMWQHANALVGYKTCPHIDTYDTGVRAAKILMSILRKTVQPTMAVAKIPMIVQAENMISDRGEFFQVFELTKRIERQPEVISASAFAVQPWLDVAELGWAAVVITDQNKKRAEALACELAQFMWSLRRAFVVTLPTVNEAIDQAMQIEGGPVVLAEGADGTMGGGPGDGTSILAGILEKQIDAAVAATVVDPVAVREAIRFGVGNVVSLDVGGKLDPRYAKPVRVTGRIRLISDGEFRYKGRAYTGRLVKMGRCVVLAVGNIQLLISERAGPTTDPELYRSHGIEPTEMKLVLVKSPLGARLEYEPISKSFISVNSPGCASPDLSSLPFSRAPRPLFPFDQFEFSPLPLSLTLPEKGTVVPR